MRYKIANRYFVGSFVMTATQSLLIGELFRELVDHPVMNYSLERFDKAWE